MWNSGTHWQFVRYIIIIFAQNGFKLFTITSILCHLTNIYISKQNINKVYFVFLCLFLTFFFVWTTLQFIMNILMKTHSNGFKTSTHNNTNTYIQIYIDIILQKLGFRNVRIILSLNVYIFYLYILVLHLNPFK